jgi:hypothetical protein
MIIIEIIFALWTRNRHDTDLMKVTAAPLSSMFASMSVKNSEKALSTNPGKVNHERVGILHGSSGALVFGYTDLICGVLC